MGARRNDDADLQLRDDHLLYTSEVPDSPMATHEVPPSPGVVKPTKSGGMPTYFPFGFIYYSTKNEKNSAISKSSELINSDGDVPVGPPRGAFPPPISENRVDDIRREVNDLNEYVASHPWYHQPTLMMEEPEFNHGSSNLPNGNNNIPPNKKNLYQKKNSSTQWHDQKAILSTTFNFTNAIIGAGAMGLGGAFAASGGGISVISLLGFAYLTKLSLDLVVDLSSCPEILGMVREFYDNEIEYESEYEQEEVEFDQEERQDVERQENDAEAISELNDKPNETDQDALIDESNTKDGDVTAQIANKGDVSPLMAQEQTIDPGESLLGIDRYDSLNDGTSPINQLPLLDITSDGNPMLSLQANPNAQLDEELLQPCTYEELGRAAYGSKGRLAVLTSKCLYSFGCLVAYVVVVRDNFGPALRRIVTSSVSESKGNQWPAWLQDDDYLAFLVSATIMLPLSCPRTMEPLAKFSLVSVLSIMFLALSVMYLYFSCTDPVATESTFYENWVEIRSFSGFFESLGTFVFTFVCHHVVNIAYESLPMKLRNPETWRKVSTNSIVMSTEASLAIGLFAYMTFGANTPADVLLAYPPEITLANISRLLLCLTMVLTFPLPFLTCREMIVLIIVDTHRLYYVHGLNRFNVFSGCFAVLRRKLWTFLYKKKGSDQTNVQVQIETDIDEPAEIGDRAMEMQQPVFVRKRFTNWRKKLWIFNQKKEDEWWDPAEPLLEEEENPLLNSSIGGLKGEAVNPSPLSSPEPSISSSEESSYSEESLPTFRLPKPAWLQPDGNGRQLCFCWHVIVTFILWMLATMSAIKAPSLGDVLDLVGAFTGTLLAFVLPALFSFKLKGYSRLSCAILSIGGFVGICGTISSLMKFVDDTHE
jgi:amino acid permease